MANSSKQATTTAQARALELKALGLGTSATAAQIIAAIQKKYGAAAGQVTIDNRTGLPYTQATARAAGSNQAGPQIIGAGILGGTVGGIVDSLLGGIGTAGAETAAADATTGAAEAGTAGGGAAGAAGIGAGGLAAATAAAITSPLDFLKLIAWIFHPQNILRAVEFVVGIILMIFGFHAAMQARGEKIEGFTTSEGALTRSGLGRVATALGSSVRSGNRQRPTSAPHRTRQRALTQRYRREENLQRRQSRERADVSRSKAPRKKSTAKKAATVAARLAK